MPLDILKRYWGYDAFRPLQEEIIHAALAGNDTLALLPTGGGKSICFQVPTMCKEGLAIVISPLIALMKDQVERLNQLGIAATYINSSMSKSMLDFRLQQAMDGYYKFLYCAPERIQSDMFLMRLDQMNISFLVVDEAHCISQWGYDFRQAYMQIHLIRERLPNVPVIAVTASATEKVKADILLHLKMREPKVFVKSFLRPNLRYFVLDEENVKDRIVSIVNRAKGAGIIYVRTRRRAMALKDFLKKHKVSAGAYHGGLPASVRDHVQREWLENRVRIMVATNAFGMGIDKPDVRFVIHYNLPFDLESYYQEAGRGGRDEKNALAIAFNNPIDMAELERWNAQKYPSWKQLLRHYQLLCEHFRISNTGNMDQAIFPFDIQEFAQSHRIAPMQFRSSVRVLHTEGIVSFDDSNDDYAYLEVIATPQAVLSYKHKYPKLADTIDYMLRALGGEVYSHEVRFLPNTWRHKIGKEAELIIKQLELLQKHGIIRYRPPAGHPSLRFLLPRQRLSQQQLNWKKYEFLRKRSEDRLMTMCTYIREKTICRSLRIQHYFGEHAKEGCGRCDVCTNYHGDRTTAVDFKRIQTEILKLLEEKTFTYREIVLHLRVGKPKQREQVLQYLIDNRTLLVEGNGVLTLRRK